MTGCECRAAKAPRNGGGGLEATHLDTPIPIRCRGSVSDDAEAFVTEWVLCEATPPAGAAPAPAR